MHPDLRPLSLITWLILIAYSCPAQTAPPAGQVRAWTDQKGRSISAALVEVATNSVSLRLANGTVSSIPITTLSEADQQYLREASPVATAKPSTGKVDGGALLWPAKVTIDPKSITITPGEQKAAQRKFEYDSGSFRFISNAPLTGTVMKEVAGDFELVRQMFVDLPWGWQPKPKDGEHFLVHLAETDADFIALGGSDVSSGGSKDDYIFSKFTSLGLKKVGARYAYDAREKREGEIVGLTTRLLLGEMRNLILPWSAHGLEELTLHVSYHKSTLHFQGLEKALKDRMAEQAAIGVKPDLGRLITKLHMPWKDLRNDVIMIRRQSYFDGMMLVYFFGFLDDDGKGTRFHRYLEAVAKESLGWRAFQASEGKTPRPRERNAESYPEWTQDLQKILLDGRTDDQLRTEILAKFRSINVKF